MTVLDNIMLGRHVRMRAGVFASFVYWGPPRRRRSPTARGSRSSSSSSKLQDMRKQPTGALAYGLRKRVELGRALALDPSSCCSTSRWAG